MLSRKLQREIYDKKYNSMKQLDRIEYQNEIIISQNNNSYSSSYFILFFVAIFFSTSFITSYVYLSGLGVESDIHLQMGKTCMLIAYVAFIFHFLSVFFYFFRHGKIRTRLEKFLEEHSK